MQPQACMYIHPTVVELTHYEKLPAFMDDSRTGKGKWAPLGMLSVYAFTRGLRDTAGFLENDRPETLRHRDTETSFWALAAAHGNTLPEAFQSRHVSVKLGTPL